MHPLDPLVAPSVALVVRRGFGNRCGIGLDVTGLARCGPSPRAAGRRVTPAVLRLVRPGIRRRSSGERRAPSDPRSNRLRRHADRHLTTHPQEQECEDVLAGSLATRTRAPPSDGHMVDDGVVGLGTTPLARSPHHSVVGTEARPAGGRGERLRVGDGRRPRCEGFDLLDRPRAGTAHPSDRTRRVRHPTRHPELRKGSDTFRNHTQPTAQGVRHLVKDGSAAGVPPRCLRKGSDTLNLTGFHAGVLV